jgi:TM2 domain-containing membrane protein YozV
MNNNYPPVANNQAQAMMMFEANKKSVGVSYLLWLFLGGFGGHRFYNGRTGSAVAQLLLTIIGIITSFIGIGFLILIANGIWILVDAFLIPGWIRNQNMLLATQLGR